MKTLENGADGSPAGGYSRKQLSQTIIWAHREERIAPNMPLCSLLPFLSFGTEISYWQL